MHARNHAAYVTAIEIEAARARVQYDMLVLPGLELTYNDPDPLVAAHAVAVGLEIFTASTTASSARSGWRAARAPR